MVAEEEAVTGVVEAEAVVDVEVSRARTRHLWVEVDAGNCLTHRRTLWQPPGCHDTCYGHSGARHYPEPRPTYKANS